MVGTLFVICCVLVSLVTGMLVFVRDPAKAANKIYAILSTSFTALAVANALSLSVTAGRLPYIRAVIGCSTIAVASIYYLVQFMGRDKPQLLRREVAGIYITVTIMALDFTPLVFSGLQGTENPTPVPSVAAPLFLIHLLVFMTASIVLLAKRALHNKGVQRMQYVYVMVGLSPILLLAPITGFLLPIVLKNDSFIFLTPLYCTFFVCMVGYAIVRHRLFDIRLVVARSLAYALSLGVLASVFGLLVFGSLRFLFGQHLPLQAQVFISGSTAIAGLAFARLKRFFDKVTNSLFYADAYDAQTLFDSLNATLVASIDLRAMLLRSTKLLASEMRTEYCVVVLDGEEHEARVVGTEKRNIDAADVAQLHKLLGTYRQNIVVADRLDQEGQHKHLKNFMQEKRVSILISLTPDGTQRTEAIGYLALGAKKSGNPYSNQDLRVLETVANELIIAMQNALHFEEIQNFNKTLQARVNKATTELRQTNAKLKQLDETKDEFISMASHQLRTPLTSVKGYLSMVLEGDAGKISANQRKLLEQSYASSQRMVYLISDLLNLSRLNTGKFVIEPVPVDLSEVVQAEIEQLVETAKARELTLTYDRPATFPQLMLDETKIHQVVMNFIDNAIYYTPAGGSVTVELRETPTAVEYLVRDTGIGVPKAVQHKLFTKFYRAANAQQARPDGTGLGLFMAKKVVVAQGGSIICESEEGKGSTFGFRFSKAGHMVTGVPQPVPQSAEKQASAVSTHA